MNTSRPRVSVVVPVYNEAESLEDLFRQIAGALSGESFEVVFVDDGSTDSSRLVMQRLAAENPNILLVKFDRNFGKSAALAAGFHESSGEIVITMDADLQDDPAEIPRFLERIDGGVDLVSGWKVQRHDPWTKTAPSRLFNAVTAWTTGIHLHDFNCGFKAYRRGLVDRLALYGELHRFIPALAYWKGFRVDELPVNHRPRKFGRSKFGARRFLSGMLDLMTVLFLTRFNRTPLHLFGSIGLVLFSAGLVINLYLTMLRLEGESIGTRPLLMLGVLLMMMGLQFFGIGLLADLTNISGYRGAAFDYRYEVWPKRLPAGRTATRRARRPLSTSRKP